jgi:hypothetical protein
MPFELQQMLIVICSSIFLIPLTLLSLLDTIYTIDSMTEKNKLLSCLNIE